MKTKQIFMIFCLFMVFISAMSFACAADDVGDTPINQATDAQDILTTDSGSFTQLDDIVQNTPVNGTIKLTNNYTYSDGDDSNGIIISKDITIDGDGHTIDGANAASIFSITNNANVVLKNIKFVNARGTNGAAVSLLYGGSVQIINSQFINNSALNGGAIYIASADTSFLTLTSSISGCTFIENSAENGAALYVDGTLTSILSSTFRYNRASNNGASMYLNDGACIDGNVFEHETAGNDGGAIYLNSSRDSSSIDPSALNKLGLYNNIMSYCTAGRDGGAGYFNASHGNIRNLTLTSNIAKHNGGGIVWLCSNSGIIGATVFNNTAGNDGGGIYLNPTELASMYDGAIVMMYSHFTNNTAVNNGGALYCAGLFSVMLNSTFSYDKAYNGAGIYLDVAAAINYCIFDGEIATNDGGAIYLRASNTNIDASNPYYAMVLQSAGVRHSIISNCIAGHDGGAGFVYGDYGIVDNLTMIGNTAGNDGGAGYVVGNYGKLTNSHFINNSAGRDGGALLWEGVNGTINNITVVNNKAMDNGGGIALDAASSQGTTSIANATFVSNEASFGGAIYCADMFTNIFDSSFAHDSADYGGAIYLDYGAYIHNATLFNETAKFDGGGIYLNSSNTDLDPVILQQLLLDNKVGVIDSVIANCTAGRDGGAGFVYGDYGIVNNLTMINNVAGRAGGAGYVAGNYGRLYNSTMINNRAGDDGGALFWQGNGGTVVNITCIVNFAGDVGGSIFIFGSNLTFTDSIFTLTNASTNGGALYIYGNNVLINNSIFDKCGANSEHGGAIYASGSNTTISNSTFTMNRVNVEAGAHGGSIDVEGNNARILDCIFEKCTAYEGGVVYINGANAVLENLSCDYSFAVNGGAFYINGDYATISNTNVSYNNATDYGGAMYIAGDFAKIESCNLTRCIAYTGDGGAIYATGLNTTISKSNFQMNLVNITTQARGGSINVQGNGTKILDCIFDRCTAYEGGVIYVFGSDVTIDGYACNRSFAVNGGAIYVMGDSASISNFNVSNTNATTYGGAIYVAGDDALINNSNFTRCIAYTQDGGALFVSGSNVMILNSNFVENRVAGSKARGGSMYIQGDGVNIEECVFTKCTAYEGGVIYINGSNARIEETSNTFSLAESGSAIYVAGNNVTICHFSSSFANSTSKGGSIYVEGDDANIYNSSFSNVHSLLGGAIYLFGDRAVVDNSTFTYCKGNGTYQGGVGGAGGSIYIEGENATVAGSSFLFSLAANYGGAIYADGANVKIIRTSYENCSTTAYNGGAIFVKGGNATISDSNFTRNRVNVANWARGGSIDVDGDDAKISGCTFDFCNAYDGGIIYVNGNNALIDGSTLTHSSALNNGGAIYVAGSNATISNSTLNFNNATHYGGAIYVDGANAHIDGDLFDRCSADRLNGGAIYVNGPNATISNSNFSMNRVNVTNFAHGGSINIEGDDTHIYGCFFDYCTAYNGAVIYVDGDDAVIDNSTFTHSSAVNNGGAIYVAGSNATISNSTLNFNNATHYGGAIYVDGANAHIDGDLFDRCSADMLNGGAVYINGLNTTISNSNFTMNRVNVANFARGGSVYIAGDDSKVLNTTFDMCIAYDGAALYLEGENGVIDGSTFMHSSALNEGGAIYVEGNNATISDTLFTFNNATQYGGSIYVEGNNSNIVGSTFSKCSVNVMNGGAIYIAGLNTTIAYSNFSMNSANGTNARGGSIEIQGNDTTILGCVFLRCAAYEGGAIYVNGTNAVIDNTTVMFSLAYSNGGGIYVAGENASIINSMMNYNIATDYGGAIYVSGSDTLINNTVFSQCAANNYHGGAIYVAGLNTTISYSNFTQNSANGTDAHGGAIDVRGNDTTIYKCNFANCTAYDGGILYISGEGTVIDNMTFAYSRAIHDGGILYIEGSNTTISNTNISYSMAGNNGGAIYVSGDNVNIINDTFFATEVTDGDGGAIYIAGENATISNSSFTLAHTGEYGSGGAIYIEGDDATVIDSTFNKNTAFDGGSIYVSGDNVKLLNSDLSYTYASDLGGAIYVAGDNAVISADFSYSNSSTVENYIDGMGGAIFISGDNTNITYSTFDHCCANGEWGPIGGAIYVGGSNTTIENSEFSFTRADGGYGGAIAISGPDTNIINSTFDKGLSGYGGTIYIDGENTKILDSSITNSVSSYDGGAIYVNGDDAVISAEFKNCSAAGSVFEYEDYETGQIVTLEIPANGGAIYVKGENAIITKSSFDTVIAMRGGDGGAVYIEGYNATIEDSYFTVTQSARGRGGALFIAGNLAKVINSNFLRANSTSGGFMYILGNDTHILNSSMMYGSSNYIEGGTGLGRAGAVFVAGNNAIVSADFRFINSTGGADHPGNGGALYVAGNNTNITHSSFFITIAKNGGDGGAIYIEGVNATVEKSNFQITQSAQGKGGALFIKGDHAEVINSTLIRANSTSGGFMYVQGDNAHILNSSMMFSSSNVVPNATGKGRGGAIFVEGDNAVISADFRFTNATGGVDNPGRGGAIYVEGNNVNITDSSFFTTIAKNGGGAIFIEGVNATVEDSNFEFTQSSHGRGGAIFINGINADVINSTFVKSNSTAGGVIYIAGDCADVIDCSMMYSSSNIVENCTGDGNGGAVYVEGDNATLSVNVRFTNATGGEGIPGNGGGIYVAGDNANITDSTFFATHARNDGFGAAVYVTGDNVYMNNDTFEEGYAYKAGAVYITGSNSTINMSEFISNNCMDDGGAIYITGENGKLLNSNFTHNTAGDDGGAIYWEGNGGLMYNITCNDNKGTSSTGSSNGGTICLTGHNVTVEKSSFNETYAKIAGGAIFATGNNVTILDTSFTNCNVSYDIEETGKAYANGGGALYVLGNNTNVLNCTFEDNSGRQGGSLYVQGNNATIDMSTFDLNYCYDDGAALYVAGENGKLFNSNFTHNTAGDDGGAIYWEGNGGKVYNITCYDNHAISSTGSSNGGTICLTGSNVTIGKSSFEQTHAYIAGGAIFITGNYVNLTDSSFKNSYVSMDIDDTHKTYANGGGSLYVLGNYSNILNCSFEETNAREGGAIYIQGHDVTIGELESNATYAKAGGSIYVAGENAKILNSNLTYSHANDGGAIYVRGDNTLIDSSQFTNNNVTLGKDSLGSGGAIYVRGASTNITHSTFLNSTAYGGDGGSVYIGGYNTNIEYSEFQHSRADEGEGGAIFIAGNLAHVHDSTFNDTQAGDGGAIYIGGFRTGEDAKILNCTIENSTSKDDGGAIYVAGPRALISVDIADSKAIGLKDTTGYGGAIYVGGDDANITQSSFDNCSAGNNASGGAIYVEGDYANIEQSTFHNTYAVDGDTAAGGAIAIEGNRAIVSESNFTECFASNGGVLFVQGRRAELIDSNITDCYAYNYGGAIYILDGEKTLVNGSSFDNCTSVNKEGGAIVINGDYTIIQNSNFTNCNASSKDGLGGGIYIMGEQTTIQSSSFGNCTSVDGGAIYIEGSDVQISDSDFVANKLVDYTDDDNYGGAIYVNGERTVISTSRFKNHSAYTGGSVYINGTNTTILNSNITNSTADYGGAVFIQGINANIDGGNISYCSCRYDGGAIYVNGTNAQISADFAYCNASSVDTPNVAGNGGAIYVNGTDTHVYDSTFLNCTAMNDGDGGAIYIEGVNTFVETSRFENTWTSDNGEGGAIYIYGANATVTVSEFITTHSKEGGAIYIYGANATVDKSKFIDSHAVYGGAIYIEGINTTVTDSSFVNTNVGLAAEWGNAHYGDPTGYVPPVAGDGGAIYIYGVNALIENATIDSSHATRNGGAIFVEGSNATISATISGSYAGLTETSTNFNVNELAADAAILTNDYNAMIIFYSTNVGTCIPDISTIRSNAYNAKDRSRVENIFVKGVFNQANYDVVLDYVLEINSTLSPLKDTNPLVYDSLIDYYNNIYHDLMEINTNRNYVTFNDHIKNNIKNNLSAIVTFSDSCTKLNTDLNKCYNDILKNNNLIRENDYNKVNAKLKTLDEYYGKFNNYINILKEYNPEFNELLQLNEVFGAQVNEIWVKANMTHDSGIKGEGGAIYVAGVNTLIHDSDISNTHAFNNGDGGAIYVTGTNTSVINSNFTNAIADHDGGAAYIAGHNTYITGDSFYKCNSKGTDIHDGGGAMYIVGDGTYVSDSNFTLSDSKKYGGAVYIAGKNTDIVTSNFIQNKASSPGGAVYIQQGLGLNTTIDYCYFFDNSAGTSAGALHVSGTNTTVNNSVFIKNYGVADGGAIFIDGVNATVQYSNLTENIARDHGGAIFWKGGHGGDSIVGCIISNNKAESYDTALGGGVYWDIGDVVTPGGLVKDTTFDSNYAGKHGGGMDWHRTVNSTMVNCTFINNVAGKDGGGFYSGDTQKASESINLTLTNCKFINNTANNAGGGISLQMTKSHIVNTVFVDNIAYFGGGILIKDRVTESNEIINCTFINCTASTTFINSTVESIINNYGNIVPQLKGKGGGIFVRDKYVLVSNSTFINCTAKEGGAVLWDGGENYQVTNPSKTLSERYIGIDGVIFNSTFIGNNATRGGAVCWYAPFGLINESTFINNNATDGGAVYWMGGVEYLNIRWNYPQSFAVHGTDGKIIDSKFIENTATNGGAIYWAAENGNVSDSVFTDNYAEKGGAIYWQNITQTATYNDGKRTIYTKTVNTGNNGVVEDTTFFANKANYESGQGGAIYWNTSSSNITDTTFLNNTASKGGAIYWVNGTKIDNSTFRFNKAHTGSAIYEDASMTEMDIIDSSFLENRADSNTFEQFKVTDVNGGIKVSAYYRGYDNIVNAMYNNGGEVYFTNVTYLGIDANEVNTGAQRVTPEKINYIPTDPDKFYQTDYEVGQIIRISVYDQNNLITEDIKLTGFDSYVEGFYTGLTASEAKLKIEHPADDYYTYLGERVGGQLVFVHIETEDISCLDDEIINLTVLPQNKSETRAPTGNITIKVIGNNGKTYEANLTLTVVENTNRSIAQFNASRCPTGFYSVDVYYQGDSYYFPQDNSSSYNVREIEPTIIIQTEDIKVGQMEIINITVSPTDKVTGNVSVYIDSVYIGDLPLVNGTIQIKDSTFAVGRHNVIGIYNGDDNFKLVRNTSSFLVTKYDPYFIIEGRTILVDDQEYLEIFISNKTESGFVHEPTGFVHLVVDGQQYYINLTAGQKGILLPVSTESGVYHVWGNYSGDDFWYSAVNTTDFRVLKHNITLNVTNATKVYGGLEKINVTFEFSDVTGNVTIRINDTEFKDVPIANGKASIDVSGFNPGNYTITVTYNGDRKYNGNTTSGRLTVKKGTLPLVIVPQNIFFGEKENITVYGNTTGWVDIYVNDTKIGDDYFARGIAESSKGDLAPGIYLAKAYFHGNDYYEPGWVSAPFEVYKLNRTVDLVVEDIIYGNVEYLRALVNASGNVTIFVNGTNRTIVLDVEQFGLIDKGTAKWDLEGLPVGTYPVEVWYNGNQYYNPAYTWGVFQVLPLNTTLSIDAHDIYVWDNETLTVTVKNSDGTVCTNAPGNITINIGGVTYSEKINKGVATFVIPNLTIGHKLVWAFYDGDSNYVGNRSATSFEVKPRNPIVNVTGQNINVGQVETIHVEIPANATGFVIITGNFTENGIYVSNFNDGKADVSVYNLASGTYSVHIVYYGGGLDNYTIAEADNVFVVSGENTPIDISVEDIFYKQTANITVSVTDGATGVITVRVINESGVVKEAILPILNGKVNLLVDNLAVDDYTVYASYSGDYRYEANSTSEVFKVKKITPAITIDSVETNSIRNATVVVHITPGTTGNVTITVNNKEYTGTIENGVARIVIDQLNSGNYSVHAYYGGDRNFTQNETTVANAVNIFRYSCYVMNVTADDTKVDLNTTIIVNVPCDAVGKVAIYINKTYVGNATVENGVAKLNYSTSIYGKYVVDAMFMDGKYANKTVTTNYHVFKWETPMVITVINESSLYVGDVVTIVVSVPDDIKDNVTIEIAGKSYSAKVIDGNATFKVANLTYGGKTVTAIYDGNYKYLFNATTHNFTIAKRPSTVVVETTEIYVGDVAIINVTVPQNATGQVIISVNGTNYTVNVTQGKGSIPVSGLTAGIYNINVTYVGDEQYLPSTNSTTLKVSKFPSNITVVVNDIIVGDVAIINMTVPADALGNITVRVNSTVVVVGIVNGTAQAIVPYLKAGNYTVDVTYNGDDKYFSSTNATKLTVNKISTDITVVDQGNGTVVVVVPGNATGNVTIVVENKTFNGTVINGTAIINLTNVTPGVQNITVIYSGDDNHTSEIINATATIPKFITPISVVVSDIYVGDVAKINVTVPANATGKVRIEINGKEYFADIDEGVARFAVENLTAGVKTVYVSYAGDSNYTGNHTSGNFTVKKLVPAITVVAADIIVREDVVINVTAPNDVTKPVIVNVGGIDYAVNITNGAGQLNVTGLDSGSYNVTVKYLGDDKYLSANNTAGFKVSKVPSNITVVVNDIIVGDVAIINMTVPADALGNITVKVNDTVVVVGIVNGTAQAIVPYLKVGNYTVDVTYNGDDKYFSSTNATKLTVNKAPTDVTVIDQGNGTVVVVVPGNATGNVTIVVENQTFNGTVINGTAIINLTNVTPGEHNITVIYSGDENHTSEIINTTITISKLITPISVVVSDIYVGDVARINVTVPVNATGKVRIEIDGKEYFADIDEGVARFKVENLTAGIKTVAVTYAGDSNYTRNFTTANFTVKKYTPVITVNASDIIVGESVLINVTAPGDVTRPVIVNVGGVDYAVNITNGAGQLNVTGLDSGSYNVTVRYLGDDKYLGAENATGFKVSKVPSSVSVKADNITVGEKAVIEVTVPGDATGNVTVTVDGKDYNVTVVGGNGILVVSGLKVGNYTVDVKYPGDRKYEESINSTKFAVNKKVTDDIVVVDQGNGTVVVVVPGNATGNVTIVVENQTFNGTVINGTAIINLTNVTPGEHNITVIYSGDGNHTSEIINATVTIPKLITPIKVVVEDIYVGDVARINVTVPDNATGKVRIEINGKEYFADIDGGVARFAVENLTAGVKTVAVTYEGDYNYTANFTTANFTVKKYTPVITVNASDIIVREGVVINVTAPGDVTRPVIVNVNGIDYAVNMTNGIGQLNVTGLGSGPYNVTVRYLGDDKYLGAENATSFKVSKVPSNITVVVNDIIVGDVAIINMTVPADATGNITVRVNNTVVVVGIVNGTAQAIVPYLKAGNYTVDVTYNGDDKYLSSTNATKLAVNKASTDITVIDQGNGTVVVVVPGNATGNVTIVVENQTFNGTVINGTAIINLTNVTPGEHNITVIYSGDGNHTSEIINATVTIPKLITPINVVVSDIYVGDIARINVTVPDNATGKVRIEIDGKEYFADIIDGVARFVVENLTAGVKTVAVFYAGDSNYTANFTTGKFTVYKRNSTVSAQVESINVGENITIKVKVPTDATGQVLLDIDGVSQYYVNVTDGEGTITIPYIPYGKYDVNVTYVGDDKYLPSSNVTLFNVNKVKPFVIPIAYDIIVGQNEVIRLIVPVDATGNVTVVIGHDKYVFLTDGTMGAYYVEYKEYTVAVSGGNGEIVIEGLPVGDYVVSVKYNGDSKYLTAENTTTFKVSPLHTDLEIIDQGNGTVVVIVPGNATGNITIEVENQTYTGPVINGTAIINLTNVTPGVHNITVIYSGDDTHEPAVENATASIPKHFAPISVEAHDIYVDDVEVVIVTVPKNATGTVTIEINGVEHSAPVKDGKAVFNVTGLEFGNKTVAVKYSGDDNYRDNYTTGQFEVIKRPTNTTAKAHDINVGENETIIANVLPGDATGIVLVYMGGVGYYGVIENGTAYIIIPELPSGVYIAKVTYQGDRKYLPSTTTVRFTATKVKTPINAAGDVIEEGNDATVVVKVPEDATGTITITVDGKKYTEEVENGQAVFSVPGLVKGDWDVDAEYSGDKKYEANDTITDIIVYKNPKNNGTDNRHYANAASDVIDLSEYPTGNPVLVVLLILIALCVTQVRRFKK